MKSSISFILFFVVALTFSNQSFSELVDPQWLQQQSNKNLIILDVREPSAYAKTHIPNAVNLPISKTFSDRDNTGFVAAPNVMQQLFSNAGIKNNSKITIYDDGLFKDASRMYWAFKVYGHPQVSLLNGGLKAWLHAGLTTTQLVPKIEKSNYIPTLDPDHLTTLFSARLASSNDNTQIIDARVKSEYSGQQSKAQRFGHIPTAINIPSSENYHIVNGVPQLKPLSELAEIYSHLDKNKPVIAYCNKGKESAISHLVLSELGFKVSVYDGGWIEWGNNPSLPIVNQSVVLPEK